MWSINVHLTILDPIVVDIVIVEVVVYVLVVVLLGGGGVKVKNIEISKCKMNIY